LERLEKLAVERQQEEEEKWATEERERELLAAEVTPQSHSVTFCDTYLHSLPPSTDSEEEREEAGRATAHARKEGRRGTAQVRKGRSGEGRSAQKVERVLGEGRY
tara:strand:- start:247 stop:561 length:315 start_codon:yes stop_codon:yes gene_type:complete